MQRKSISNSSANVFNASKAAVFPLSIQWIYICILPLKATISYTHLKTFHLFSACRCLGFSNVKKIT